MFQFDTTLDFTFEATPAKMDETVGSKILANTTTFRTGTPGTPSVGILAARNVVVRQGMQKSQTGMSTIRKRMVANSELKKTRVPPAMLKALRKGTLSISALEGSGGASDILKHSQNLSCASQPLQTRHRNIDRPNLITKRLKVTRIPEPSAQSAGEAEPTINPDRWASFPTSLSCFSLLSEVLRDSHQQSLVCDLSRSDAQLMADYLDLVSREASFLQSNERRRALYLLCKLTTSAQVFPRCYELPEIGHEMDMELVGGGGFSDVYKGKQGGRSVCLKIIRVCRNQDSDCALKTTGRELALWAHLSHPHILPLYGIYLLGPSLPRVCLVSPWMENGNLRIYLTKFPQKPRMPLISDIVDGLVYLHGLGIVHSDLKAENILVSDDGHALIADFGVSSIAASTKLMSVTPHGGTTRWMAPELLTGSSEVRATKSCDIWSFACLCYEVFTRKLPFYQYRDFQVLLALTRREVPLRPDPGVGDEKIDERVWELLMKCWSYTPEDRPSCETVREFIKDMGIQVQRPKVVTTAETISACLHTIRRKPHTEIDYIRVNEILSHINQNTTSSSPTGMGSSGHDIAYYDSYWILTFRIYYVFIFLVSYFVVLGIFPD